MRSTDEEGGFRQPNRLRNERKTNGAVTICLEAMKWLPVLFIIAVISWSYYAFVIQLCLLTMKDIGLKVFTLIVYHFVLILFLWSYWQTIFSKSGRVPRQFKLSEAEFERLENARNEAEVNDILEALVQARQLPLKTRTNISQIRFCDRCSIIKPDRCHHCSVCSRCVLKMDHHCPWVNNCVCFDNYKFFVLFLAYAFLYCFVVFAFSMKYFIEFWSGEWNGNGPMGGKFHILFVFFVSAMFAASLSFLFGYHCFLITKNRSTLESFRSPIFRTGPDGRGFNLGTYENFVQIFGEDKRLWFLPIFTSLGDGITFQTRLDNEHVIGNYNSVDTTDASSGASPDTERCVEVKVEKNRFNPADNDNANNLNNGLYAQSNGTTSQVNETSLVHF